MKGNVTSSGSIKSSSNNTGDIATLYLKNNSQTEINSGDKVLIKLSATDVSEDFSSIISTQYNSPLIWYDNTKAQVGGGSSASYNLFVIKEGDTWTTKQSTIFKNIAGVIDYSYNQINMMSVDSIAGSYFYTDGTAIAQPSYSTYLGNYNGTDYLYKKDYDKVYTYNLTTNTTISEIVDLGDLSINYAYLDEDIIFCANKTNARFAKIADDGTISQISLQTMTNFVPMYVTGLKTGEYILTTVDSLESINSIGSNSVQRSLIIYQIDENYKLNRVTIPCLEQFEYKTCTVNYDCRSNLLCIGTMDGVYLFKYENNNWYELPLNIDFSTQTAKYCYRGATSPDSSLLSVQFVSSSDSKLHTSIYSLNSYIDAIVPNYSRNYSSDNCFTGFATGNVNEEGLYEVEVLLPQTVTFTLNVTPDPDSVEFKGGEE